MMENWDGKVTNLAHQLKRPHGGRRFPLSSPRVLSANTERQRRKCARLCLVRCENGREGSQKKKKQWMGIVGKKKVQGHGAPAPLRRV